MSNVVRSSELIACEINLIKTQTAKYCLNSAVEIGKLLVEAKEAVPFGEWGSWLQSNVDYSESTAQNLMKLFNTYGQKEQLSLFDDNCADIYSALAPSKALALAALPEKERKDYVESHDVESESVRELKKNIEQLKRDLAQCENGYEQTLALERKKLKDSEKAVKDKDKEIKKLMNDADASSARANEYFQQLKVVNERADKAETQLQELSQRVVDEDGIREEYQGEIDNLKNQLLQAKNSNIQRFAVHFELFQKEFNVLRSMISEEEPDTANKFREAVLKVLAAFENSI